MFALLISGIFFWKTTATYGITYEDEFHQGVRNALAEINLSTSNNLNAINSSSDNLANFIYYRSGVQLNQKNKDSLSQTEQNALEQSTRVSQGQLTQILTDVSFEKLVTLSDSQISAMSETLRGFNSADLSPVFIDGRRFVRLRSTGEGTMDPAYFENKLKEQRNSEIDYQNRLNSGATTSYSDKIRHVALSKQINKQISTRASYLAAASPDFFDGSPNNDMTPMQAMLLTYSVVTNDMLIGNQMELQQKMSIRQQDISNFWGQQYPSPAGSHAYGDNGYIFSTPLSLLLDDAATTRIINLIKERSNLR